MEIVIRKFGGQSGMTRAKTVDEGKLYKIETWLQEYGTTVLRFAVLYTGNGARAEAIFAKTFAYAYRRLDLSHLFLTDRNAVYAALAAACKWSDKSAERAAEDLTKVEEPQRESQTVSQKEPHREPSNDGSKTSARESSEDVLHEDLERLLRVSPDSRVALLLATVAGLCIADLTRILLVPRRWVRNRLAAGLIEFDPSASLEATDESLMTLCESFTQSVEMIEPDEELRERTRKVVRATVQEVKALHRHRGPGWLTYATVTLGLLSIFAIDFGIHRTSAGAVDVANTTKTVKAAKGLPAPLTNLPVTTEAQFGLSNMPDASLLQHAVPSLEGIYFPSLEQAANNWPSIQLQYVPYSASGKNLESTIQSSGEISMIPPMVHVASAGNANASPDWKVTDWRFDISGNWAFAAVSWSAGTVGTSVTQVYGLYLPTGQSNLIQTLGVEPNGESDSIVVAAGDDHLVVQTGVHSPADLKAGSPVSGSGTNTSVNGKSGSSASSSSSAAGSIVALPIDVYRVTGTTPLQALGKAGQISAPFGMMQDPAVFSNGIVFARPSSQTDENTTWYLLSWNGDTTKFAGPPNDGQRHFAVSGLGQDLWWIETTPTPSRSELGAWQVVMGPLETDASVEKSQTVTLSSSVAWFTAYKSQVCWIQNTDNHLQLVVASVQ